MSAFGRPTPAGIITTLAVGLAAVLCCAGPALLAGGALSGLGAALRSPWLIGAGAIIIAVAGLKIARSAGRQDDCRPPDTPDQASHDDPSVPHQVDVEKQSPRPLATDAAGNGKDSQK